MDKRKIIAFDTETECFEMYNKSPEIVCLSWAGDIGKLSSGLIADNLKLEDWLDSHLDEAIHGETILVGHNTAYDMACVLRSYPNLWNKIWKAYEAGGIACTETRERLLNISVDEFAFHTNKSGKTTISRYGLANLAKRYFSIHVEKGEDTWRTRYSELKEIPVSQWPKEAVDYAIQDAELTYKIYFEQEKRKSEYDYDLPTEQLETRSSFAFALMSSWGITTDRESVETLWNAIIDEMESLVDELIDSGLVEKQKPSNIDSIMVRSIPEVKQSMKKTKEMIKDTWKGKGELPFTSPSKKFPMGQMKTGKEVIVECSSPALQKLVTFTGLQKLANTYVSKLFDPVIHPYFINLGASTSRTACADPNVQNQPKFAGVRECFIAREGYVFLDADFDSQEMRTLAQSCLDICGGSKLAERYIENKHYDPHTEFASHLLQISPEDAKRLFEDGDETVANMRQRAKIANFGFPGGMKPPSFVNYAHNWGVELNIDQAKEIYEGWLTQWPEMRSYFKYVETIGGNFGTGVFVVPQSGFQRAGINYNQAANSPFQSLGAHCSKSAMWEISRRAYSSRDSFLYGSRPVAFIHDEFILEVPEFAAHLASIELENVMVEQMQKYTPNIPASASSVLMRRWTKQAKRVLKNGRLIPWEDSLTYTTKEK